MPEKYNNKYRISSTRLAEWDYGANAQYFVTICTKDREHYFGAVIDNTMQLSPAGKLAQKHWQAIPGKFPFVVLDVFVVMPNHIHGVIIIDKNDEYRGRDGRDAINRVSTTTTTTTKHGGITGNKNPMLWDNLSRVIRWYKGRVSFELHKQNAGFAWQSRFYDHVIHNERSHRTIVEYIKNNPLKWEKDNYNKTNENNGIFHSFRHTR